MKVRHIIYSTLVCLVITVAYGFGVNHLIKDSTQAGVFGDSFGALNTTFAGLGFFLIAYSLFQQKEALLKQSEAIAQTQKTLELQREQVEMQSIELKLQREELAATRIELERSAKANEETTKALENQLKVSNLSSQVEILKVLMDDEIEHIKFAHKDRVSEGFEHTVPNGLRLFADNLEKKTDGTSNLSDKECAIRNLRTLAQQKEDVSRIYDELRKLI